MTARPPLTVRGSWLELRCADGDVYRVAVPRSARRAGKVDTRALLDRVKALPLAATVRSGVIDEAVLSPLDVGQLATVRTRTGTALVTHRRATEAQTRGLSHRRNVDTVERVTPGAKTIKPSPDGRTIRGHVALFDTPTVIYERSGEFVERIAPGAFAASLARGDRVLMQWNHGTDPAVGQLPVGVWQKLVEDQRGLYGEGRLSTGHFGEAVRAAIRDAGGAGASFRFSPVADRWRQNERTLLAVNISEAGAVAFGAYPDAALVVA